MTVKPDVPGVCVDTSSSACTVARCATDCTDIGQLAIKTRSLSISNDITVDNAVTAMNQVRNEYLNCMTLTTKFLDVFAICETIHPGMKNVGAGAGIGLTAAVLLVVVLFLGQKRFFSKSAFNKEEAELTLISRF
jgi:hypothetical protein